MLKFYFGTIIFYMIVIFSVTCLNAKRIKENGWLDGANKSKMRGVIYFVAISCVPLFRLTYVIMLFVMGSVTKEKYEEELEKYKNTLE